MQIQWSLHIYFP